MKPALIRALLTVLTFVGLWACSKPHNGTASTDNVDYYTCTMHPSVHSKTPGHCPICGMDLVPVLRKTVEQAGKAPRTGRPPSPDSSNGATNDRNQTGSTLPVSQETNRPNEFSVPVERQQQIGVTYTTVQQRPIRYSIRSIGVLEPDRARTFEYVARVDGYLQDLKVTSPGENVKKDQPLLTVYSPDLRSTEQELVNLLNTRDRTGSPRPDTAELIASAEQRLRLWNVSEPEINALETSRRASSNLVLRSPFNGVIEQVAMTQGASVKAGDRLLSVVDLSQLWLWAQFYENESGLLKLGQSVNISVTAFPEKTFHGAIAAIDPRLDAVTRTTRVRIDLANPRQELRPGMFANVELEIDFGEGLTLPVDAVLPTGSRGLVFVDKGDGKLEPRFVQVEREFTPTEGAEEARYYQVQSGLKEGERVVSSANFLIDAESQIQGALRDFEEPEHTPNPKP
jgi:Cu(I)/Ag(I) efflux system membrane fusion protein